MIDGWYLNPETVNVQPLTTPALCESSSCDVTGATDCGESRQLPSQLPLRRLFALDIMRQLAAHLRRQRGPEAAAQLPAGAPDPVLQVWHKILSLTYRTLLGPFYKCIRSDSLRLACIGPRTLTKFPEVHNVLGYYTLQQPTGEHK